MAVMTEHTMKAFDADLQELSRMIAEMGGLAERLIGDAVDALNRRDAILAQSVIAEDAKVDLLQREIEEKAILTIARRQPMAVDLRDVVGALHEYEIGMRDYGFRAVRNSLKAMRQTVTDSTLALVFSRTMLRAINALPSR